MPNKNNKNKINVKKMQQKQQKNIQQDQSPYTPFSSVPELFKSTISTQPPPPQLQQQIKKIRREYQTKIIQLENEVKYLKEDVEYKQDAHQRQMENLKAVLQYQYTVKIRDIKGGLRQEYAGFLAEGTALRDKNKYLEEEIRLLRLKYERSQKYCKQIQILSQQKLQKECKKFEQRIQLLQKTTQSLKTNLHKQKQQKQKEQSIQIQKLKQEIVELQQRQKQKEQKIEQLQKNIIQLTRQIKLKIVQQEELRIQKDKIIQQLSARLVVLREATVMDEVRVKKENRDDKLREIDENVGRSFQDQARKMFNTIDVYRNDLQRQILLQKEMKKRWQTQTSVKPQIKKINGRKRSSTNDLSESCSRRQASVADSPRFGIQARLDFDLC